MRISRRSVLTAIPLLGCAGAAVARARAIHITPDGAGDGASWETAAALQSLDDLLLTIEPGGEVLVAADRGPYNLPDLVEISNGGRRAGIVRVRGVSSASGEPMPAVIRGTRAPGEMGSEAFRLLRGADHLHFAHFTFHAIGNGCFRVGGPIIGLTIEDCTFQNVYRFFENTASGDEDQASIRQFVIRRCTGDQVERSFSRIRYSSRDGLFEDCRADGLPNEGGDIPVGCALDDRASRITYRRCVMEGFQQWRAGDYWNGDGFSDEERNTGIRYEACEARGSTDGGFDCKSEELILENCVAEDNKRNFRIWSQRASLTSCTSRNPNLRGPGEGAGEACHVWIGGDERARVRIANLTIEDRDATPIVEFEHDEARVEIRGVTIRSPRVNWGEEEDRIRTGMLLPAP